MRSAPSATDRAVFDALTDTYDGDFTRHPIASSLRARTHSLLNAHLSPTSTVLELGCGTGEDARLLAPTCRAWTATDASPAMRAMASGNLSHTGVTVAALDLNALPQDDFCGPFTLISANFGVINCVDDLPVLANWLARRVSAWGMVCLCIMSRYCLWETLWHGLHRDSAVAFRRWGGQSAFQTASGTLSVTYPMPDEVTHAFASSFDLVRVLPLGVMLPPSDVYGFVERQARLLTLLTRAERALQDQSALAPFADHYWIELRRMPTS